eukprot:10466693-Lingulodinium_polyedra.AAC.1
MAYLQAVDHLLAVTVGTGLVQFVAGQEAEEGEEWLPPSQRRTLTLFFDQGSPSFSMATWCLFRARLRMAPVAGIFHREWNDAALGIKRASCWWAVVAS